MIEKTFFSEDLIRDQKTRTVFGFEKQNISVGKFTQKISLILSFSLFLWFWAFRETQQCTCSHDKQSASLYTRQDSIDMSAVHTLKHMHTAFSCCNRNLMHSVPRRGLQSSDAKRRVHCVQSTRTHSEGENAHGVGREGAYEHSGRQHDHQYHEHQSPHHL